MPFTAGWPANDPDDSEALTETPLYRYVNDLHSRRTTKEQMELFCRAMWSFVYPDKDFTSEAPTFSSGWYANRAMLAGMSEQKIRTLAMLIFT